MASKPSSAALVDMLHAGASAGKRRAEAKDDEPQSTNSRPRVANDPADDAFSRRLATEERTRPSSAASSLQAQAKALLAEMKAGHGGLAALYAPGAQPLAPYLELSLIHI